MTNDESDNVSFSKSCNFDVAGTFANADVARHKDILIIIIISISCLRAVPRYSRASPRCFSTRRFIGSLLILSLLCLYLLYFLVTSIAVFEYLHVIAVESHLGCISRCNVHNV